MSDWHRFKEYGHNKVAAVNKRRAVRKLLFALSTLTQGLRRIHAANIRIVVCGHMGFGFQDALQDKWAEVRDLHLALRKGKKIQPGNLA